MYVDGFVVPVKKSRVKTYVTMAKKAAKIWKDHGALSVNECIADDVKPGKWTSFPQSVKLKRDETVVFSWIHYKSRAHRDSVNARVMKDVRFGKMMEQMRDKPKSLPFDGKRMIFGGFTVVLTK